MAEVIIKKSGDPVRQISVMLSNRIGSLSALLQQIRQCGEEVVGMSMQDSMDATIVRLIVTDADIVLQSFLEKGVPHTTCKMVVVALRNVADELEKCLKILRDSETNIDFSYSLISHPNGRCLIAFHLCDHEFGAEMLRCGGIKVMFQEDISR